MSNQAFLPEVAVNDHGVVAVLYYDWRVDEPDDVPLSTQVHVAFFDTEDLSFLGEQTTSPTFDPRSAPRAPLAYFPGDYVVFTTGGDDFLAAFTMTNPVGRDEHPQQQGLHLVVDAQDRQDVWFARVLCC